MNSKYFTFTALFFIIVLSGSFKRVATEQQFISYTVNPKEETVKLYWKDNKQQIFKSIGNLREWLHNNKKELVFAMNGGMYTTDNSPLGLYIENGKTLTPLNTRTADGNFYMMPNGVFYITKDNIAAISTTSDFKDKDISYATQSGPMLLINGKIHPEFKMGAANLQIRNGVGILPNNNIVFAMSEKPINFYDFATYFKKLGCKNALYLDGYVSRVYSPFQKWEQTDGNFGVIIGVTQ
jgi:uncharacterized protein YigE (DUF2233 family)